MSVSCRLRYLIMARYTSEIGYLRPHVEFSKHAESAFTVARLAYATVLVIGVTKDDGTSWTCFLACRTRFTIKHTCTTCITSMPLCFMQTLNTERTLFHDTTHPYRYVRIKRKVKW